MYKLKIDYLEYKDSKIEEKEFEKNLDSLQECDKAFDEAIDQFTSLIGVEACCYIKMYEKNDNNWKIVKDKRVSVGYLF